MLPFPKMQYEWIPQGQFALHPPSPHTTTLPGEPVVSAQWITASSLASPLKPVLLPTCSPTAASGLSKMQTSLSRFKISCDAPASLGEVQTPYDMA